MIVSGHNNVDARSPVQVPIAFLLYAPCSELSHELIGCFFLDTVITQGKLPQTIPCSTTVTASHQTPTETKASDQSLRSSSLLQRL